MQQTIWKLKDDAQVSCFFHVSWDTLFFINWRNDICSSRNQYIAVALVNGRLELRFNLGTGPAVIKTNSRVDTGTVQEVILWKIYEIKKIVLQKCVGFFVRPPPIPCFFHYNLETAYCTRTIIAWNSSLIFIFFAAFISQPKVIMQGKLFQRCTHLLYCSVLSLGGNLNTRRMSQPDMGSIFHIKNQWNILVIENYFVNYQNFQINARILNEHLCIYSCLQIPPKENWFQYVRRVYTTAINFPCITPLGITRSKSRRS